jgi:beta-glucosidase-like glycosyl hydrolase
MWESFGEDAYLSSQMGAAMVAGFEGDDVNSKYHVSCMKHFIGYKYDNWKDRTVLYPRTSFKTIRSNYLPSSNKRGQKYNDQFW